jgi:hypothetical protein
MVATVHEGREPLKHFPTHPPLSRSLAEILGHESVRERLSLNFLLDQTEGRGLYLVMILLCLPFITPLSLPGTSVALGMVIMALSARLAFELPPHLPHFIGDRSLPMQKMKLILRGSVRLLKFLETLVKPRRSHWMTWQMVRSFNALLIVFMAFLLALPLPPIPPFTNMFPSYAIILLSVSMMEEDGVMIWLGYAAAIGTTAYFLFWAGFICDYLAKLFHAIVR